MKKFLAIVFALIFALSACTVAFAGADDLTCDTCLAKLADEKAYNAHVNGGCLVDFKACQYCEAKVATANLEAHEAECPKGASACDKCGADLANKAAADAHECAPADIANNVLDKAIDALKNVDWADVANKIVDAVKGIDFEGIIAKIKPIFEKVVELVKGFAA
ncbi:MAG: hypothetical protein E7516_03180 [Ruminococcaceae bacterium]|nr:hypothetical protein [Oscillospiraceae bacterium]